MRSGGTSDHCGLLHEAAFYGSEDEFLAVVVPFLADGIGAGEPTVAAFGARNAELIRTVLGDTADISFLDAEAHYTRPANAIKIYQELLVQRMAEGAHHIRVAGEIPGPGTGLPWEWWARYESTLNHVFDGFPLWVTCTYDTRSTPGDVLADVARTHPQMVTAEGGHNASTRYQDPPAFLTRSPACGADPLEADPPMIDLVDPAPADARRAVEAASTISGLNRAEAADMVYAANEAVTNALCHGMPSVHLRVWSGPHRTVVTVTDRGHGPADPFVGLLPPGNGTSGGVGLWLVHQVSSHVTLGTDDDGFTIRLVGGTPDLTLEQGRVPSLVC